MAGGSSVGMRGVRPLRNDGEQLHAFPAQGFLRGPPVDVGFAVIQASVPSRSPAEENGPPGALVLLPELRLKPHK